MRYTRRHLLQSGAVGLAAFLAGCGAGQSAQTSSPAAALAATAASKPASTEVASAAPATKPAAGSPAKPSGPAFSIAWGSPGGFTVPLWLTDATNAFTNAGVTTKVSYIESSAAVSALIAGDVDAILLSAAPVITADLNGNADLVIPGSISNWPVFALYGSDSIKTAADVKGKVVASDRPGTPTDFGARLLLGKLGLKASDVKILPVGGSVQVLSALASGQAQAGALAPPSSFQAEDKGFHQLTNIFDVPYQGVGVVMRRSRLDQLTPAAVPFFKGLRQGVLAYNAQPDLAMQLLSQYSKETDSSILKRTYEFFKTQAPFEPTLKPTTEGIQSMIDFLAESIPAAKTAKANQFIDGRFLGQIS